MSTADVIILIILGLGAVRGFQQGFIVEVFSLAAFFLGIVMALLLTIPVTTRLFGESRLFELIAIVVFIALFVMLSIGIRSGGRLIKNTLDVTILGKIDSLVGGITGILKYTLLISIVYWIFESLGFGFQERLINESQIFPYIVDIGPQTLDWVSGLVPILDNLMDTIEDVSKSEPILTMV